MKLYRVRGVTTGKEAYVRALDPLAAYKRVWREWREGIKMIEEKDPESDHCWIRPADGGQLETKIGIEEIPEYSVIAHTHV